MAVTAVREGLAAALTVLHLGGADCDWVGVETGRILGIWWWSWWCLERQKGGGTLSATMAERGIAFGGGDSGGTHGAVIECVCLKRDYWLLGVFFCTQCDGIWPCG